LLLGSEPSNGTATVVYDSTETTLSGVTVTKGTWSYTPNSNFFGTDQFNINLLYGGGAVLEYTIDLTINPV
jgi:hypothetical protein